MDQFTFYDLYYETFNGLKDEEIGRFIKRICNYALYDLEDEASKNDTENCLFEIIFPTLKEATLLEKQGKVPYYLNRSMKHFTFKIAYANIIKTIKDEKLSGKFIKAICAYMFDDEIPIDLTPPIDTYFKLFKKSFDLTKTRIKSGHVGGSKKKKEIINKRIETLEDFLNNNLHINNDVYSKSLILNKDYNLLNEKLKTNLKYKDEKSLYIILKSYDEIIKD